MKKLHNKKRCLVSNKIITDDNSIHIDHIDEYLEKNGLVIKEKGIEEIYQEYEGLSYD